MPKNSFDGQCKLEKVEWSTLGGDRSSTPYGNRLSTPTGSSVEEYKNSDAYPQNLKTTPE
jgi:hypothetical protein